MYTRCPKCGAELRDPGRAFSCPGCGATVRSMGAIFEIDEEGLGPMATIGMYEGPRWKGVLIVVQHMARLAAIVLFALALLLCFVALFVGVSDVFAGAPGSDLGATLYLLLPLPVGFATLTGTPFLVYYSLIVVAIILSGAYLLWRERRELWRTLSSSVSRFRAPDRRLGIGIVQLPQIFLAILFFDILYALVVALTGTTPRTPAFGELPGWYLYFTFANASVYEEITARTILLGIPLMLAYVLAFSTRPPRAGTDIPSGPRGPAQPAVAKRPATRTAAEYLRSRTTHGLWGYILGGGFTIGPLEAFFIVGSSLMFGLAHVSGWDIWKALPTFVAGLGFGYLFLKVGIHAAVLLHFSFDYLSLGGALVPGYAELEILLLIVWTIVGAFYFGHYALLALEWLRRRGETPAAVASAPAGPAPSRSGRGPRPGEAARNKNVPYLIDVEMTAPPRPPQRGPPGRPPGPPGG